MKKETNNKGFSLVELIIVIAIMVILVAVLAPQYLRYVEKSRVSSDAQTVVEFINIMQTVASDPDAALSSTGSYTVDFTGTNSAANVSEDLKKIIINDGSTYTGLGLMTADDISSAKLQSTAYKGASVSLKLEYNTTSNTWAVKTSGVDNAGKLPTTTP